jgi:hypothetical protein
VVGLYRVRYGCLIIKYGCLSSRKGVLRKTVFLLDSIVRSTIYSANSAEENLVIFYLSALFRSGIHGGVNGERQAHDLWECLVLYQYSIDGLAYQVGYALA